ARRLVRQGREFVYTVVTRPRAREGGGGVGEYMGGYGDGLRQRPAPAAPAAAAEARPGRDVQAPPAAPVQAPARRKLSYKDQRELEQLPARIEQLEARVAALTDSMHDPAFYLRDGAALAAQRA